MLQAGLDQFGAQASSPNGRRDASVRKDDELAPQHVIEHGKLPVNTALEALFFGVMRDYVFCLHRFIFIPICDFVNPSFS